jgi:PAS domain S-box-containing protein
LNSTIYDPEKIFEYSLDIICIIDEQGNIIKVSDAASRILGYDKNELTGYGYKKFIYPEDRLRTQYAASTSKKAHTSVKLENCCIHKNGTFIPFVWSVTWDEANKITYCIGHDGTPKKQAELWRQSLEESNKRYDYVTRATSDAIWDWDLKKDTLYWGDGFETIFGYDLKETIPHVDSWTQHIHPEDYEHAVKSIYSTINGTETNWKEQYRYLRANNTYAYVVDRGFVIRDDSGKAIRMVGAMHDISERKKSEGELKQFAKELYKQNNELLQFGYIVSHNLRSPVANIIGITNLMELEKSDPQLIERCIKDLKTSGERLDTVIRDLSHILSATDRSGEVTKEKVDLTEVLNNVLADLHERIVIAQADIEIPQSPRIILSHKAYIYSIFFNLISNAIKYRSDKRPEIKVAIEVQEKTVIVKVSDNGIGIDMDKHSDDIFKPYKRFDYSKEGKGLGLFLVKSHVEALNGSIFIESATGKGTVFTIILDYVL